MFTLRKFIQRALAFCNNKYLYAAVFFIVWIVLFDNTSLINHANRMDELERLRQRKVMYISEIATLKQNIYLIETDMHFVEKYARENYRMKHDDEDIFIFSTEIL